MRFAHLDALRGVAALVVTYYHLSRCSGLAESIVHAIDYRYLRVEIFFVLSGFILPYSLYKANYRPSQYGLFLLRRLLRIDPAYIAAIIIAVSLVVLSGRSLPPVGNILLHLGYVNAIVGEKWLSPVFWTLAIEFQFYLLLGLIHPLLATRSPLKFFLFIAVLLSASVLIPAQGLLPHWIGFFVLGTLTFRKMQLDMPGSLFWPAAAVVASLVAWTNGLPEALVGFFSCAFILYVRIDVNKAIFKPLLWLGAISYSLYLTHWDIGRTALVVLRRVPVAGETEWMRLGLGMCTAIVGAWMVYWLVEKPCIRLGNHLFARRKPIQKVITLQKEVA